MMGFAVLHLSKAKGNDAGMSGHIERKVKPANADESRTHLNEELIKFPAGIKTRTQAIAHRIENAGIKRKITTDQVRAIRILLSGSPEDMQRIEERGELKNWCNDNLEWLYKTFGKENVVSATLHRDEKSPHIHATVVPIVKGEPRKARNKNTQGKKKYKKSKNTVRLCADDVMSRQKLTYYQDSYAEAMQPYGLERGIKGSEASHKTTQQYYKESYKANQKLKQENARLQEEQQQKQEELNRIRADASKEKLKNSATQVASSAMDAVSSLFGNSKVKDLEKKVEQLHELINQKEKEKESLDREYKNTLHNIRTQSEETEHKLQKIAYYFPHIVRFLPVVDYCRKIGFSQEQTRQLVNFQPVNFEGKLYSHTYTRYFHMEKSVLKLEPIKDKSTYTLTVNGVSLLTWFRMKRDELLKQEKTANKRTISPKVRR